MGKVGGRGRFLYQRISWRRPRSPNPNGEPVRPYPNPECPGRLSRSGLLETLLDSNTHTLSPPSHGQRYSMSNSDPQNPDNHSDWQLLAEFLIPSTHGMETQVMDHITGILGQFGLEPGQMDQIMSAVNQSLLNLEGSLAPLHLRISISGVDLDGMLPEDDLDRQVGTENAGGGLGFFLVNRIVGQLQERESARYRLLEVLIYRESGRT
jgi:hypothetical protein